MIKTRIRKGVVQQRCHTCKGTGWEEHECVAAGHRRVKHPLNGRGLCVKSYLCRCNCGRYWRTFYDDMDDSIDLPGDEFLGKTRPPNDWEPEGGWDGA